MTGGVGVGRQLLAEATKRPWKVVKRLDQFLQPEWFVGMTWNPDGWWDVDSTILREADAEMVVFLVNHAEPLLALWEAAERLALIEGGKDRYWWNDLRKALARLEAT